MIVLDTNVVSFIFNGNAEATFYQDRLRGQTAAISFQTLEELWYGAHWSRWGSGRSNELRRHLGQYRVIWPTPELAETCARLRSRMGRLGRTMQIADAWIVATAIMLGCPIASHDKAFRGVPGLRLIQAP